MLVKEVLRSTEEEMKKAVEATRREFSQLRSGRANPKMIEGLRVDYYGSPTLLKEIANISVPEARMLIISPWDPNSIKDIEKAILQSDLGITPLVEGKIIRLIVPPLSEERRGELVKVVKKLAEEGKISLRTIRRNAKDKLKTLEKEKKISEDDHFRADAELQKLIDKYSKEIENLFKEKEKELQEI